MGQGSTEEADVRGEASTHASPGNQFPIVRTIDGMSGLAGVLSAIALLAMTAMILYEVGSRYLFNNPTSWVIEISTYVFVAASFLGMTAAQRHRSHVQVEILVARLKEEAKAEVELIGHWVSLFFVIVLAWKMAVFNYSEYVNDTRDWGLLATPQWIPELSVSIGLALFAVALLGDALRTSKPKYKVAQWLVPLTFLLMVIGLLVVSEHNQYLLGTPLDLGILLAFLAVALSVVLWSGLRTACAFVAVYTLLGTIFYLAQGTGMTAAGVLLVASLLLLLLAGVRVGLALGIVGFLGLLFLLPNPNLPILADRAWGSINTFTLTAVPMFVLMGNLLIRSGVTEELFDAMGCWFGRTPGGLANASVGASAMFAAVSGSSLATAATLGQVAAPEMIRRGYSPRLAFGVVAAGATLGILIPPSIAMIIYGNKVGASITKLFMAGMIPGLVLAALFIVTVFLWSFLSPGALPKGRAYSAAEKARALLKLSPMIVLIVAVLGSLYAGIATPTEAGGVGAFVAMLICIQRRRLSLSMIYESALETVKVTSFIMLIVIGAAIFSWVVDFLRIPRGIVGFVESAELAPWLVVLAIGLIYLALGTLIESISMMLMTLGVTFPIIMALGIDPIWFGVVLVLLIEIGLVTPPVGIILFVLRGISGSVPLRDIVLGVAPFVAIMLSFIVFLYFVPEVVLWLPENAR